MIILLLIVLGLVLGSFVNALVWRLREQDELDYPEIASKKSSKGKKPTREELSILRGRSMCPDCHHTLAAKDLVPVFSWLSLEGKCRYCRRPISWQYPVVEALTALFFVISYISWPSELSGLGIGYFAAWLLSLVMFVALAVYDFHWFELPDRVVWPLAGLAIAWKAIEALAAHDGGVLMGSILGAVVIAGLFGAIYFVSKGQWIGFGDVKLGIALGLLAGSPLKAALVIFVASIIGTFATLPMLLHRKKHVMTRHIPFGPALLLATFIVVLWGDLAIQWYMGLF